MDKPKFNMANTMNKSFIISQFLFVAVISSCCNPPHFVRDERISYKPNSIQKMTKIDFCQFGAGNKKEIIQYFYLDTIINLKSDNIKVLANNKSIKINKFLVKKCEKWKKVSHTALTDSGVIWLKFRKNLPIGSHIQILEKGILPNNIIHIDITIPPFEERKIRITGSRGRFF